MSNVVALRERHDTGPDVGTDGRPTVMALVVDAVVQALRAYPLLNASIDADGRTVHDSGRQHIGVTVDTDKGVVVPVIKDAGDLNLRGLSRRIDDLTDRAGHGALLPDDLTAGTFTVTNTGSRGVVFDTPILVPGQVGIVGAGDIVERAVVVRRPDGERAIAIRSMAYLALTYDHRLVDGADAARFLTFVKERLQSERSAQRAELMFLGGRLGHLAYSTLVHQGDTWEEMSESIETFAPAVKARVSPDAPYGLSLRISAASAETLTADPAERARFRRLARRPRHVRVHGQRVPVRTVQGPRRDGAGVRARLVHRGPRPLHHAGRRHPRRDLTRRRSHPRSRPHRWRSGRR